LSKLVVVDQDAVEAIFVAILAETTFVEDHLARLDVMDHRFKLVIAWLWRTCRRVVRGR
jgi:hypothetical protein